MPTFRDSSERSLHAQKQPDVCDRTSLGRLLETSEKPNLLGQSTPTFCSVSGSCNFRFQGEKKRAHFSRCVPYVFPVYTKCYSQALQHGVVSQVCRVCVAMCRGQSVPNPLITPSPARSPPFTALCKVHIASRCKMLLHHCPPTLSSQEHFAAPTLRTCKTLVAHTHCTHQWLANLGQGAKHCSLFPLSWAPPPDLFAQRFCTCVIHNTLHSSVFPIKM